MTNRPHVHIVLLNWNGWPHTVECLESVMQLDYPSFSVIVCDNGSSDDSVERLRDWLDGSLAPVIQGSPLAHPIRPVRAPIPYHELDLRSPSLVTKATPNARAMLMRVGQNRGFAGGNNVALRHLLASNATGFVLLLNNDTVIAPDALTHMVALAESDSMLGCVGATLLEYHAPNVVQAAGGGRVVRWQGLPREHSAAGSARGSYEGMHPDRLDFVSMGCMLVSLDVVRRVGVIDERYFAYCEDIDYSLRVRAAGYRVGFEPLAEVWHKGSASFVGGSSTHDYHILRSALLFVDKFYPEYLPIAAAYLAYRCALPKIARGQWERLGAVVRGYRDFARTRSTHPTTA